jgi:SNF2 family DNA or RNA helicase
MSKQLYPFQRQALEWLAQRPNGIIGLPVGSGKTVIAARAVAGADTLLVVAPNIVKQYWADTLWDWTLRRAQVVEGTGGQRAELLQRPAHTFIINHEMLRDRAKYPEIWARRWDAVIVDEAHRLQGRPRLVSSGDNIKQLGQQSRGAELLRYKHLYMLSGTPIWNRPDSLWHLLRLLDKRAFGSYWRFCREFCDIEETPWATIVRGIKSPAAEAALHDLVAPYVFYRTKEQVLPDLPPKVIQPIYYEPTASQRKQYRELRYRLRLEWDDGHLIRFHDSAASAMVDLRRVLNGNWARGPLHDKADPKLRTILELLDDLTTQKVVVFTWLREYAFDLANSIADRTTRVTYCITGDMPNPAAVLQQFQRTSKPAVLVATIASIGESTDALANVSAAIFAEGSFTPVQNEQAEGRLHRIGTKVSPVIYRVMARKTLEEKIWKTTDTHQDLTDALLTIQEILDDQT